MAELLIFFLGKKGALMFRRPDGSLGKTGIRIRDGRMFVCDGRSGEWLPVPDTIEDRQESIALHIEAV